VIGWFDRLFVEPLVLFGFMRYGVAAAAIVGISSAVLSCLLVVRREALLGDAIAHATLLGVAVGYLVAGRAGIFWGALAAGVATGAAITFVERNSRIKADAAMGILFTFAFALGLAIISIARPRGIDIGHVLLGNVLGVGPSDLLLTGICGALVLVTVTVLFRPLQLWSFDPESAQAMGVPVRRLHYLLMMLLSATIVAALQAVGLVLVIAMLITPGSTALLLTDRLRSTMIVAAVLGATSGVGGLYGSYHLDVASGPAMVLFASALFGVALLFSPRRGMVVAWARRRRLLRRGFRTAGFPAGGMVGSVVDDAQLAAAARHRIAGDGDAAG
jgi:ABC-type Mn2+/Zn2+ transport system permease subunit